MHKILKLVYRLPSGTKIDYDPQEAEVSEEDLSYILRIIDGESFDSIAESKGFDRS